MDTFTCEKCGQTFPKAWSDEEATAEMKSLMGDMPEGTPFGVLCDDCYKAFRQWFDKLTPEDHAKIRSQKPSTT